MIDYKFIGGVFLGVTIGILLTCIAYVVDSSEDSPLVDHPLQLEFYERFKKLEGDVNGGGCIPGLRDSVDGNYETIERLRDRILVMELKLDIDPPQEDIPPEPPYEPEEEHKVKVKLRDHSLIVPERKE